MGATVRAPGLVCLLLVAGGLVGGRNAALVDWREVRAVVLESDDWGLCGFVPDSAAMAGLTPADLEPGAFPAVYWGSTLEDSLGGGRARRGPRRGRGRDGMPAVLQPNYILSSLAWEARPGRGAVGRARPAGDCRRPTRGPACGPRSARPRPPACGTRNCTAAGTTTPRAGARPPCRRRRRARRPGARSSLFPGSERAWELGPWRSRTTNWRRNSTARCACSTPLFGRPPRSVIAPDYHWDDRCEDLWLSRGLTTIQAKRGQRRAEYAGLWGRVRKVGERTLARQLRRDRVYLDRNVLFEPVAERRSRTWSPREAVAAVATAWRRGEPAIVETHRVNFAHLDPAVAALGRSELAASPGRPRRRRPPAGRSTWWTGKWRDCNDLAPRGATAATGWWCAT